MKDHMELPERLLAKLACPQCKGELVYAMTENALDCPRCGLRYPVTDGIPVLLIDEAKRLA